MSLLDDLLNYSSTPRGLIPLPKTIARPKADVPNIIVKSSLDPNKVDIVNSSYFQDADEQLTILSHVNETISDAVWKTTRAAKSGWFIDILNLDGTEHRRSQKLMKKLVSVFSVRNVSNKFLWKDSFKSIQSQLIRLVVLRGGVGSLAQLNSSLSPDRIVPVDPNYIDWEEVGFYQYKPWLKDMDSNINDLFGSFIGSSSLKNVVSVFSGKHRSLDIPNFSYARLDGDVTHPYCISPLTPTLKTVFSVFRFLETLQEVMDRVAWPRMSLKIIEEKLSALVPPDIVEFEDKKKWLEEKRDLAVNLFTKIKPGHIIVHGDWLDPAILSVKDQGNKTLDPSPFISFMNRLLAQGAKTYDAILGGSDLVDPLQAFLHGNSIKGIQEPAEDVLSENLTFFLRAMGENAIAEFKYLPFELKPESDLESSRVFKIKNDMIAVAAGAMTPQEFSIRNTGTPLPKGSAAIDFVVNNIDVLLNLIGSPANIAPSETDTDKSPAKGSDSEDNRSGPDPTIKRGKTPGKSKVGGRKNVRGKNRPSNPKTPTK